MLLKLLLIVSLLCFTAFSRLKAEDSREESGDDIDFEGETSDVDDDGEASGDNEKPRVTASINQRKPPSAVVADNEEPVYKKDVDDNEEYDNNGGAGIVIDETEGEDVTSDTDQWKTEQVEENSLITHPGILAAIIIGGVLVLICLVVFFILIVCCVRKKDEGTYDLDSAMKQKLKYVAYTKADTSPDKEFFA